MQYQVFLQNQAEQRFIASVVGIPNLSVEGSTEAEAIAKVKDALAAQLATGKWLTIEMDAIGETQNPVVQISPAETFVNDPTFDDWMEKLSAIRRTANTMEQAE
jgi:predicted RNase H-like HicB family nuclease